MSVKHNLNAVMTMIWSLCRYGKQNTIHDLAKNGEFQESGFSLLAYYYVKAFQDQFKIGFSKMSPVTLKFNGSILPLPHLYYEYRFIPTIPINNQYINLILLFCPLCFLPQCIAAP